MTKIDFEYITQYGVFRDALHIDDTMSTEQIEAMKQERLKAWIDFVENPPEMPFIEEYFDDEVNGE
jgi:hypothetical protein